ncbi:MAG: DUF3099 domain-containing protein [Actinomycetes bacterium]
MRAVRRSEPVYRITGAQTSLSQDQRGRTRRYLWSMGIRTLCFLGAIVAQGPLRWVLVVLALVLPWVSVIGANVGREQDRDAPPTAVETIDRPALGSGRPGGRPGPDAVVEGPTNQASGA